MLLIERIRELEQQVEELRQGVPFVDENTVRSFLTQIDLAYTEDLENQTKVPSVALPFRFRCVAVFCRALPHLRRRLCSRYHALGGLPHSN